MTREDIIKRVFKKYNVEDSDALAKIINTPVDQLLKLKGYEIDFTGYQRYFTAVIEAREEIVRAGL